MTTERPRTCPAVSVAARLENFIDRHSVRLGAWLLRRTRGRVVHLWHRRALVLTTRGRRSGIPRTVVVQHFPDGRDMVVVAANSGMPTHPAWYLNLTDDPRATVEVEGRTVPVRAVPMTRDEAGVWWLRVLQTAPDYARYPARTDRPLPLLRLVPVDEIPEVTPVRCEPTPCQLMISTVRLTEHDALAAHLDAELSIDPEALIYPWQAAGASVLGFTLGAMLSLRRSCSRRPPGAMRRVCWSRSAADTAPSRWPASWSAAG